MATELVGQKLVIKECDPMELPPFSVDEEGLLLDPLAGVINQPKCFAMILGQEVIGTCSIYNPSQEEVEFGIWITAEHRSKGYGSEAAKILSDYYLSTLGFSRVHLKVLPYNVRAIKAYEMAGFNKCGKIVVDTIEFVKMERRIDGGV
jgi:RimJ/RimL family protein N-acetyltransferase